MVQYICLNEGVIPAAHGFGERKVSALLNGKQFFPYLRGLRSSSYEKENRR